MRIFVFCYPCRTTSVYYGDDWETQHRQIHNNHPGYCGSNEDGSVEDVRWSFHRLGLRRLALGLDEQESVPFEEPAYPLVA